MDGRIFTQLFCQVRRSTLARVGENHRHHWHAFARNQHQVCSHCVRTATYGETIQIHTSVQEWREKTFVHKHVVMRDDTVLCEGTEVRAFCIKHPDDPDRIKAIAVPQDIQVLCS